MPVFEIPKDFFSDLSTEPSEFKTEEVNFDEKFRDFIPELEKSNITIDFKTGEIIKTDATSKKTVNIRESIQDISSKNISGDYMKGLELQDELAKNISDVFFDGTKDGEIRSREYVAESIGKISVAKESKPISPIEPVADPLVNLARFLDNADTKQIAQSSLIKDSPAIANIPESEIHTETQKTVDKLQANIREQNNKIKTQISELQKQLDDARRTGDQTQIKNLELREELATIKEKQFRMIDDMLEKNKEKIVDATEEKARELKQRGETEVKDEKGMSTGTKITLALLLIGTLISTAYIFMYELGRDASGCIVTTTSSIDNSQTKCKLKELSCVPNVKANENVYSFCNVTDFVDSTNPDCNKFKTEQTTCEDEFGNTICYKCNSNNKCLKTQSGTESYEYHCIDCDSMCGAGIFIKGLKELIDKTGHGIAEIVKIIIYVAIGIGALIILGYIFKFFSGEKAQEIKISMDTKQGQGSTSTSSSFRKYHK